MRKFLVRLSLICLLFLFCSGCFQSNIEDMLIGTWDVSLYLSPSQVAKMSEESFPEDFNIEMTMLGTQTYHLGGRYNGTGEFTIRMKFKDREIPLKFLVKDAGSWEMHSNILVETSGDSVVTPLDEITRNVVKESPWLQTMLTPVSGESQSTKIIHISGTLAEFKMVDPPYIDFTLRKKS